jgi:DUF4097 and DUF4098 domain-containing protein YvlB
MQRRTVLAGVAGTAAALAGCADVLSGRESRTVESDHEVPEGTPLAVVAGNGAVEVDPTDGERLEVSATVRGPSTEAIEAVEVAAEERDGEFLVTGERDGSSADDVSVALTVGYPSSTPVGRVETGNGSLEATVASVAEEARLTTGNGSLEAALDPDLDATVEASTGNGTVSVEGFDFTVDDSGGTGGTASGTLGDGSQTLAIETGNGSLEITSRTG